MRQATLLGAAAVMMTSATVMGQCPTYDFEDLPPGTTVTNQYPGVTFSVVGGSGCVTHVEVLNPDTGCSSPDQAIKVAEATSGCDFHEQYLKMAFDPPARSVSFTVGPGWEDYFHDYRIVAYRTASGPGVIDSLDIIDVDPGVRHAVTMYADGADLIRRIYVVGMILPGTNLGGRECIDDLRIESDETPPEVDITSPAFGDCICSAAGDDLLIYGTSCDSDGPYEGDRLEYRPVGGSTWYPAGQYSSPLCSPGELYSLEFDELEHIDHGWFEFRITAENLCGMSASESVVVFIDMEFGMMELTQPAADETVCGTVEVMGSVDGKCFDSYSVDYKLLGSGTWLPVNPAQPTYTVPKAYDCMLAMWNTQMVDDGVYWLRLRGVDDCNNVGSQSFLLTVDNSEPCGCTADVNGDGQVDVDDLLMIILTWGPCLP